VDLGCDAASGGCRVGEVPNWAVGWRDGELADHPALEPFGRYGHVLDDEAATSFACRHPFGLGEVAGPVRCREVEAPPSPFAPVGRQRGVVPAAPVPGVRVVLVFTEPGLGGQVEVRKVQGLWWLPKGLIGAMPGRVPMPDQRAYSVFTTCA